MKDPIHGSEVRTEVVILEDDSPRCQLDANGVKSSTTSRAAVALLVRALSEGCEALRPESQGPQAVRAVMT